MICFNGWICFWICFNSRFSFRTLYIRDSDYFAPCADIIKSNIDAEWFGRESVFNTEGGLTWMTNTKPVIFPEGLDWKAYVDSRRLEITCGEAPYIVSRYDSTTGELIPVIERIGLLDRKLRVVNENAADDDEWLKWSERALQSVYGYEFQGDNLLIARINLLGTYCDYYEQRFGRQADKRLLEKATNIICWNFWQMNGLNDSLPYEGVTEQYEQMTFFEIIEPEVPSESDCQVFDWRARCPVCFKSLKKRGKGMKFDYVIGNPPYQEDIPEDGNKTYAAPIYNLFLEGAYSICDRVEMIHPARFLFNAGSTPKAWNKKMLSDEHLKVLYYDSNSSNIFPNTEIKGGIAITYRDALANYGEIGIFTPFMELNSIIPKILNSPSLSDIVFSSYSYHFTETMHNENPTIKNAMTKGHLYDLKSNIFEKLSRVFWDDKPNDNKEYIRILGRIESKRAYKWIRKDYITDVANLFKWKIVLPAACGNGRYGEELTESLVTPPSVGLTETFCSIGAFDTEIEANNLASYIKCKFTRSLLGILKATQHITPEKWKFVPLQDFTPASDIDWSKSISEIDRQLYKKYGLSQDEIDFIESHVKEMS